MIGIKRCSLVRIPQKFQILFDRVKLSATIIVSNCDILEPETRLLFIVLLKFSEYVGLRFYQKASEVKPDNIVSQNVVEVGNPIVRSDLYKIKVRTVQGRYVTF